MRAAVTQLAFTVSYSYLDWDSRTHGMVLHAFRTGLLPPLILSGKTQVDTPKISDSNLPDKFKHGDIFHLA